MKEFRDLKVWRQAMDFAEQICTLTPGDHVFSIQIQRARASVAVNIAEGIGIKTEGRKLYHFKMARGSLAETIAFIELMYRLGIFKEKEFNSLFQLGDKIYKELTGLI